MQFLPFRLLAVALAFASASPAFAQAYGGASNSNAGPGGNTRLPDTGRSYTVRITTGAHETTGWEHSLTDGDPNLKHWTWMPISSFDQAYIQMNARQKAPQRPEHVYVKPNHVATPVATRDPEQSVYVKPNHVPTVVPGVPQYQKPTTADLPVFDPFKPKYTKPNHVPLPIVEHPVAPRPQTQPTTRVAAHLTLAKPPARHQSEDVFGKLTVPAKKPAIAAVPAKTYGDYQDVYGRFHPPTHTYNSGATTGLSGKLLRRKTH